ncbi:MAG TPA: PaaI family thioesterase [Methanothrix sp.]|jgi:acyl-CoA thioesterase|uniref:PaaI family thioesterase n=1 Tax=Methanothrix sp. TaxID=90426 RepID=UPI002BC48DDD|nr:PaaI family thioesterase [Methanothrix sp.]MDI9416717.1 PaaI family thioesterase [Euryarchaeota archaeon]HON35507.1 PaaI family thioesterase [Methanothrix sp.]HRU74566.1 PaaI family thioesterase [Methanothrix sp.]
MDQCLTALKREFSQEPYAQLLGIEIIELEAGHAILRMRTKESMSNLFGTVHGAAIYSLLDAAFELTVNSHGTVAVALGVNVNYLSSAHPGEILLAEGREINRSRRIASCDIRVTGGDGRLVATCQALAYRMRDRLPFLPPEDAPSTR